MDFAQPNTAASLGCHRGVRRKQKLSKQPRAEREKEFLSLAFVIFSKPIGRFHWRIHLGEGLYCYKFREISPLSYAADKNKFVREISISTFSSILNQ